MIIQPNDYLASLQRTQYGPRGPRKNTLVPPTDTDCDCVAPRVVCSTNGIGQVLERCVKCDHVSLVGQRPGTPITNKRRAAELQMFPVT